MRSADRSKCLDGRGIVEQHAPTAVDLDVDEARHEKSALKVLRARPAAGVISLPPQIDYLAILDDDRAGFEHFIPGEHRGIGQDQTLHRITTRDWRYWPFQPHCCAARMAAPRTPLASPNFAGTIRTGSICSKRYFDNTSGS